MWQQNDLEKRLRKVEGLKYLPPNEVKDLRLDALGCDTQTILFREEYFYILEELERRRPNIGGVVTGHPGIGTNLFITERLELPCSRIHNIQENQFFCFICFSNSSAWGSPLHYNATNLSSFFLKMASKNMTAIPWGGFFNSRRKSGLCQIPMKAANTHVNRFNGLVSRTKRTSSKQPLRQEIGGTVGVRSVVHVQS